MPKSYSGDLRERVIEAAGLGTSRREAVERFEINASSSVDAALHEIGSAPSKPRGRSVSPLQKFAEKVLALVAEQPD